MALCFDCYNNIIMNFCPMYIPVGCWCPCGTRWCQSNCPEKQWKPVKIILWIFVLCTYLLDVNLLVVLVVAGVSYWWRWCQSNCLVQQWNSITKTDCMRVQLIFEPTVAAVLHQQALRALPGKAVKNYLASY